MFPTRNQTIIVRSLLIFKRDSRGLIKYIEFAYENNKSVVGRHLSQLAEMVKVPLAVAGGTLTKPLPFQFLNIHAFSNVQSILKKARHMYPVVSIVK